MRQLLPGAAMSQTDVATANPPTLVNCAACFVMGKLPAVNCRTCAHATPELDGKARWSCASHKRDLRERFDGRLVEPGSLLAPQRLAFARGRVA